MAYRLIIPRLNLLNTPVLRTAVGNSTSKPRNFAISVIQSRVHANLDSRDKFRGPLFRPLVSMDFVRGRAVPMYCTASLAKHLRDEGTVNPTLTQNRTQNRRETKRRFI